MKKLFLLYALLMGLSVGVCAMIAHVSALKPPMHAAVSPIDSKSIIPQIKPITSGKPVRIEVPSLNIDLSVVDGTYYPVDRTWSLGKKTAQYAVTTSLINDLAGNTFIYGHNNKYVFNNLIAIQPGTQVIVTTDKGNRFYYTFRESVDVKPHQVDVIKHDGKPMLTVQTCVGQYFEQRRMFRFEYVYNDEQPVN